MNPSDVLTGVSLLGTAAVGVFVWLGRRAHREGKQESVAADVDRRVADLEARVQRLEVDSAVSRNSYDTIKEALSQMRADMDRRFDALERMITGTGPHRISSTGKL